jgi:hypothetical protein
MADRGNLQNSAHSIAVFRRYRFAAWNLRFRGIADIANDCRNVRASFANLGIIWCAALSLLFFPGLGLARDLEGKYANAPLKHAGIARAP